ncbi:hypothetical protein EXU57_03925 [Segetibacter sp. 3557_3]|uniref:hypothetical protein n=1 Tax=Segetibacter sp. 3557_3 TaxID=2547429 RepID=UPI001059147E|nr:hypothetical protein [Segetibacter sp. 3557_3]TDH29225.1 hypothetical protein EXU57_03925 [Segetibacter sp. 3557_3]
MEATIVLKTQDFTPDFADGLIKVFGTEAMLNIKVEYDLNPSKDANASQNSNAADGAAPKRRGRKPGSKNVVSEVEAAPKKRGRKPKVAAE